MARADAIGRARALPLFIGKSYPLVSSTEALKAMNQSMTLLDPADPRHAPVASYDRSLRLAWVVVTAPAVGGPYSIFGDYRSLRQARHAAAKIAAPAVASVLLCTFGNVYLYSGPLKGR